MRKSLFLTIALLGLSIITSYAEPRKLTWAPPTLENPTTIKIAGENPEIKLDQKKDYILEMPKDAPVIGQLSIWGGRNIVLIGGEILLKKGHWRAVYLQEHTGVMHFEGVLIRGDPPESLSEGFNFGIRQTNCVVQIQNVRIETIFGGMNANHSDLLQTWAGPAELRVDGLTGFTTYQGMFLLPNQHFALDVDGFRPKKWVFKNINIEGTEESAYILTAPGKAEQWPMEIDNVWVQPKKDKRGNPDLYLSPKPKADNDPFWAAVKEGAPPDGDFVPAGLAGRGYVSPGYLNPPSTPLDIPLKYYAGDTPPQPAPSPKDLAAQLARLPKTAEDNVKKAAQYLVVDLSGGSAAEKFPTRKSATPPNLTDDKCRTTELWLRLIHPGSFIMGSPEDEPGRGRDREMPHIVTLTKPFYIGVFPITQKQYEFVTGANPSEFKGDARPVEMVNFRMIRGYQGMNWPAHNRVDDNVFMGIIRAKTGLVFDLPTDAQWEYACRAGTATAFNNGKGLSAGGYCPNLAEVGRYTWTKKDGRGGFDTHTKVGSYAPNAWGIYDMHGNVSEWCLDRWTAGLGHDPATDPVGNDTERGRVIRGGSFNDGAGACRAAYRIPMDPLCCVSFYGFRVCVQVP
ncbi:MAG: formylglycine-generating enzyme family protein, partial [Kiritimatiellaeota bacterium]|nr:formylglycine-generating enzyme family protein [Kiritimatiellota bacterium]